ncbi:MAG: protein-export chaperone SecB [Halioglobus sp.]|nr:protein-export chaperone SecB [Halioglobus sp.]
MSDDNNQNSAAAAGQIGADTPIQAQFGIKKVYIKDMSFEAPNSPAVFTDSQLKPQVDLHFANATTALGNDNYEVVLTVTATMKADDKTIYLAEIQQAGIFGISGVPQEQLPAVMATACPNILLPFAREALCDIVGKGGFPQLLIAPVNFELLYLQEMQRRQREAGGENAAVTTQH